MMESKSKYGLIVPKKHSSLQAKKTSMLKPRLAAFNNDDDSSDDGQKYINSQIHKEAMKKIVKKQTKLELQKALEQDATVFEYDSIYDDMKMKADRNTTPKSVQIADKQKKPKYIGNLIKAAERRNRERQRVEERKIEKERKQEGDQFSDKPQFVTSAYKKRMEEREKEEEEERRMAAIEDAMDVRKQKDLSGFYKHLLRRQVGEESLPEDRSKSNPMNHGDEDDAPVNEEEDRDTDLSFSSSSDDEVTNPRINEQRAVSDVSNSSSSSSDDRDRMSHKHHSTKNPTVRDHKNYDRNRDHDRQDRKLDARRYDRADDHDRGRDRRYRESSHGRRDVDSDYSKQDDKRDVRHTKRERHDRDHESKHRHDKKREYDDRTEKHEGNRQSKLSPDRKRAKDVKQRSDDAAPTAVKHDQNIRPSKDHEVSKPPENESKASDKFKKRTDATSAMTARERYLARKKAGQGKRAPVESDSD